MNLPLSEGYTTIVGPNGSGKSNIVDSICFVLGSSSVKTMRGERLVDLVHTAAKDNKASVELTLRKGDKLHKVVREIDKKGVSVFRLDGRRTTRNRIVEFLSKINIHPDGHNVIMQGDVTNFLEMTPTQRRQVIDEISGIAEYESKKTESMKELEKVDKKLNDSEIVLTERKAYLNVLEKEKKEAEKYQKFQEELNLHKASVARATLKRAEIEFEKNKEFVKITTEKITKLQEKQKDSETESKVLEKKIKDLEKTIFAQSSEKQKKMQTKIEEIKSELAVSEEKIKNIREKIETSSEQRQQISEKVSEFGNQINKKENELEEIFTELDVLKDQENEKQEFIDDLNKKAGKFDSDIGSKYKKLESINEEIETEKEKLHALNLSVKSLAERYNLKKAMAESKGEELSKFETRKDEIEKRIGELDLKKIDFEGRCKKISKEFSDKIQFQSALTEKIVALGSEIGRLSNRIHALDSKIAVAKTVAGRGKAVEALVKNEKLTGIRGTIADLCNFKPQYGTAINAAAGTKMNCVITETLEDAIKAIQYLKQKKLGTASFLPLDSLDSKTVTNDSIVNLIKYNKNLSPAFNYIFGDISLADDLPSIKKSKNIRVVTFDGDFIHKKGRSIGGYTKEIVSLSEIKDLDKSKKLIVEKEEEKRNSEKQLEKLNTTIFELREKKSEFELKFNEASVVLKQWANHLNDLEKAFNEASDSTLPSTDALNKMKTAIGEKDSESKELEEKINKMIFERQQLRRIFADPKIKELNKEIRLVNGEIEKIKEGQAGLKEKAKAIKIEIAKAIIPRRGEFEEQIKEIDGQVLENKNSLKELDKKRGEIIKILKEEQEKTREIATSMTDLFKEKEELDSKNKTVWQRLGRYTREIQNMEDHIKEKEEMEAELEKQYNHLKNAFKKYKEIDIVKDSVSNLKAKLESIEAELQNYGYVNMKALEMFNVYEKEVKDISVKTDKLKTEKESILNLVDEIEGKKLRSFTDTFDALKRNFNKYYQEFYPEEGTYASLKLDDDENALQSGLMLVAQPAAKKMKSLEAMSGGEKVVTALAFLFAIQAYKPSPFYVLDEIDAALDKENSQRIARMLKKFSNELQFILVTHNAHVIKASDQVVGVHMNKEGSSVLEIDLKGYVKGAKLEK